MNQAVPFSPTAVSETEPPPDLRPAAALPTPSRLNDYYELTKPRLNFLVLVTTVVGFYMASGPDRPDSLGAAQHWILLLSTIIGTALCAAAASVLNQLAEIRFDKLMPRTRHRPLPAGRIGVGPAAMYGAALGIAGVTCLALLVNLLTAALGLITIIAYVLVYTPMKRRSTLNTVIGAIPGAIPPVMGWTAARNGISPEAATLFCILFFWQMPHFLAIAILYRNDYAAGGFMMLPVVDEDLSVTSRQILMYGAALIPVSLMPTLLGMTGRIYFVVALALGLGFLACGFAAAATRTRADARKLFFASIIYLPLLLAAMMANKL
jgi:protoheme IX farnesyltransferase